MVGQGLVQRKTNEIRVLARIPNDSPPMGIVEITDNVFRRKIAEQSCLRRSIGGKRGMLHLSYMVICQIRKQAGIKADALHSVCGQRLRGNLHYHMCDATIHHHAKIAVKLTAFRCRVDGIKPILFHQHAIGADIRTRKAAARENLPQEKCRCCFALGSGNTDNGQILRRAAIE